MSTSTRLPLVAFLGWAIFDPSTVAVQAQDFTCRTNSGTITITGYTGAGGAVTIPGEITGLPVTSIGNSAFWFCTNLTSVVIPNNVSDIGSWAFQYCSGLTSVAIGSSVTNIRGFAFSRCSSLTAIDTDPQNPAYGSLEGVLFNKNHTTLIQYPGGKTGNYTIPNSVTLIESCAFEGCTGLTEVIIPNSVSSIGAGTFAGCLNLITITIGRALTILEWGAFDRCPSLTTITVDPLNSAYSSTDGVLFNKNQTSLILCPGGKAGNYTVPNSVNVIEGEAFNGCLRLTSVTILNSVTSIVPSAFFDCSSLMAITVDAHNPAYGSTEGVLFNKDQTTLIQYPGGKAGNYTVPNSVTSIGEGAFCKCTSLTSVAIPGSVTSIGQGAFWCCTGLTNVIMPNSLSSMAGELFLGCSSLNSLTLPDSVTSIGNSAFDFCLNLIGVYFTGNAPFAEAAFAEDTNTTIYYLPGTTGWESTFGGRPTAPWVLPHPVILTAAPNFGIQTNGFGFRISWATNASVVVDAATDLGNSMWSPVSTNTLTDGWSDFRDPEWKNCPSRFYRVRSP